MEVVCEKCKTLSRILDAKIPLGRSYFICPPCGSRINVYKGCSPGMSLENLAGVRFFRGEESFLEEFRDRGHEWRVVEAIRPCPIKGTQKKCELENKGRCPNERLVLRLRHDRMLYKSCLYREGRRIFDVWDRPAVGKQPTTSALFPAYDEDTTYRIR